VLASKSTSPHRSSGAWRVFVPLISLAACLLIGFGATLYFVRPTYEKRLAARDAQIAQLNARASVDQQMVDMLRAENLQMVSLNKLDPQPKAKGRVIWDRDRNKWHVTVFDMMPPPPGRCYELWFIKPDKTSVASSTFMVDASGNASMMVDVPKDIGPIAVAAITDEPMGGVTQPTGKPQLAGEVH
jgi:anti-sigma-K factor RskA